MSYARSAMADSPSSMGVSAMPKTVALLSCEMIVPLTREASSNSALSSFSIAKDAVLWSRLTRRQVDDTSSFSS